MPSLVTGSHAWPLTATYSHPKPLSAEPWDRSCRADNAPNATQLMILLACMHGMHVPRSPPLTPNPPPSPLRAGGGGCQSSSPDVISHLAHAQALEPALKSAAKRDAESLQQQEGKTHGNGETEGPNNLPRAHVQACQQSPATPSKLVIRRAWCSGSTFMADRTCLTDLNLTAHKVQRRSQGTRHADRADEAVAGHQTDQNSVPSIFFYLDNGQSLYRQRS